MMILIARISASAFAVEQKTDWSELKTKIVLDRIQNLLDQLAQAIH